jgi:hypothetical protein
MKINLSPQRREKELLTITKEGDVITINEEIFDFSQLPNGATLPREAINSEWIISDVERIDGQLHFTLLVPHGYNAPEETRFPHPILNPPDGEIELPLYELVEEPETFEELEEEEQ